LIAPLQNREQIRFGSFGERRDCAARRSVAAVKDELA